MDRTSVHQRLIVRKVEMPFKPGAVSNTHIHALC